MASKRKLQKFCRIYQWIEANDNELANAIRDLCLEGALAPNPKVPGITFLYPTDKAYRTEIIDKAYSNDADIAVQMIEALIIPDKLLQSSDFNLRAVGGKTGVRYSVESATGGKVKLAGGVELTVADDFRALSKRHETISVWKIGKGRLPLSGEKYVPPIVARRRVTGRGNGVRGGGVGDGDAKSMNADHADRIRMISALETEYIACKTDPSKSQTNIYLCFVLSLMNFLKMNFPEKFLTALVVADPDPIVTCYLLIQPHKTMGTYLIPNNMLFGDGAWNGTMMFKNAVVEYEALFKGLKSNVGLTATDSKNKRAGVSTKVVPMVFSSSDRLQSEIDICRRNISEITNPKLAIAELNKVYSTLETTNSIGGCCPVYPDSALRDITGGLKLWQDNFRFMFHGSFQQLEMLPRWDPNEFRKTLNYYAMYYPGNSYTTEIDVGNLKKFEQQLSPILERDHLAKFIQCTDFLYMPVAPNPGNQNLGSADPADLDTLYDRNGVAFKSLAQTKGAINSNGISPKALQELQMYVKQYGSLPQEVLDMMSGARR